MEKECDMIPGLVIHDLPRDVWKRMRHAYSGWAVVSEKRPIHPCIGCFGCWNKTPGQCVVKDGYEKMGALIHHAREVVVISRYTYGGFSGFVKNVFDRSLGYVLPQFEIISGESHHQKRYEEDKAFTFIFYGKDPTEEEKDEARRYVKAVCTNIRGYVKDVQFVQMEEASDISENRGMTQDVVFSEGAKAEENQENQADLEAAESPKLVFLNGSMRGSSGNSGKLAAQLAKLLPSQPEIIELKKYLYDLKSLTALLADTETIVLCIPLYVDGLPSQVIRWMETFKREYAGYKYSGHRLSGDKMSGDKMSGDKMSGDKMSGEKMSGHKSSEHEFPGQRKKIYILANMGLYESRQLVNLFSAVKQWCRGMHFDFCGGLGVSAGEMIGVIAETIPFHRGPAKKVADGLQQMAEAISAGEAMEEAYAEPYHFPRALYIAIANHGWKKAAKGNGIRPADLYRKL